MSNLRLTSFTEEHTMDGLQADFEIRRIQRERREKAVAWITQLEHQVKRRVLRKHLNTVLEASNVSVPAIDLLTNIGGVALCWDDADKIVKHPHTVCHLLDKEDSQVDTELQYLLGDLPRVVRTNYQSRDIGMPSDDYHLILPNGDTTYDIVTARRTVATQPEIGPQSVYTVSSQLVKV